MKIKDGRTDEIGKTPSSELNKNGGLTPDEKSVMGDLVSAWNKYIKLDKQHPNDCDEFAGAIHIAQGLLAIRIVRRQYPEYWRCDKN